MADKEDTQPARRTKYVQPKPRATSRFRKTTGISGAVKDMSGNVIGGYYSDGQAFGTKESQFKSAAPAAQPIQPGATAPATGNVLNARQSLFRRMQGASPEQLAAMRGQAASLGVTDSGWQRATAMLPPTAAAPATDATPATAAPAPAPAVTSQPPATPPPFVGPPAPARPSAPPFVGPPAPAATQAPAAAGTAKVRVNSLTGLPFGFRPGDAVPQSGGSAMQQLATDSQTRQSAAPPLAAPAPAPAPTSIFRRGPASQPTPTGPTTRPDGYQARSLQQDSAIQAESAKARQTGTLGSMFRRQGQPELAKAFPKPTANPPGLRAVTPTAPVQDPAKKRSVFARPGR